MTDVVKSMPAVSEDEIEVSDKPSAGRGSFRVPAGRRLSRMDSKNLSSQVDQAEGSFAISKDELAAVVRIDRRVDAPRPV